MKMRCAYLFLLNRSLHVSPCTLINLSRRRSHLPVAGRPSWPDSPSTPSREPSGSFPKSFSRLQWSRSSLVEFKANFFTISGTVNLPEPALDQVLVTECHRRPHRMQ